MAGQLPAMEAWEPDFVPDRRSIQKAVVWLRLSRLPLEYWLSTAILAIAVEASKPLSVDDFINFSRKMDYARVKVEIDARKLLKPRVLIREKKDAFWQQFVYKNLPVVCY